MNRTKASIPLTEHRDIRGRLRRSRGLALVAMALAWGNAGAEAPPLAQAPIPLPDSTELSPPPQSPVPEFVAGELLVRFEDSLERCAAAVFSSGESFHLHTTGGTDSLDQLFSRWQVRGVNTLAPELPEPRLGQTVAALRQGERSRLGAVAGRFSNRTARAAVGSVTPLLHHLYRVKLPPKVDLHEAAAAFAANPHVTFAEPNGLSRTAALPDDSFVDPTGDGEWRHGSWDQDFADLWGHEASGWREVWERRDELWSDPVRRGGGGVVVAVVDTGVDYLHEDLAANIWRDEEGNPGADWVDVDIQTFLDAGFEAVPGEDYDTPDGDPQDFQGHGTHVAGTIGARADNGRGIAGIAWNSQIMPVRAGFTLDQGGQRLGLLENDDIFQALVYATDQGADIINMSFGGGGSQLIATGVEYARSMGVVLVAAAGNFNLDTAIFFPAADEGVIAAAAGKPSGERASFSNWGGKVDLLAPGYEVLSLRAQGTALSGQDQVVGENYIRASGTSMASPHVAAAAALVLSAFPALNAAEVEGRLLGSSTDTGIFVNDGDTRWALGAGRLDLAAALNAHQQAVVRLQSYGLAPPSAAQGDRGAAVRIALRNAWIAADGLELELLEEASYATEISPNQGPTRRLDLAPGQVALRDFHYALDPEAGWGLRTPFELQLVGAGIEQTWELTLDLRPPRIKEGWPVRAVSRPENSFGAPALADLNGDDRLDVVVVSHGGGVFAVDAGGELLPGWPIELGPSSLHPSPIIADVHGDGSLEIAAASGDRLYLLGSEGQRLPGWPQQALGEIRGAPALGDVDGDGDLEVFAASQSGDVQGFHHDGTVVEGWPVVLPGGKFLGSVVLADLDGGGLDVLVGDGDGSLHAWHGDGTYLEGSWPVFTGLYSRGTPAAADLDGDGEPEIASLTYQGQFDLLSPRGQFLIPRRPPFFDFAFISPAIGDLDGDGEPEIVIAGDYNDFTGAVFLLDSDGSVAPGWPFKTPSWVRSSPTLVDLDDDGDLETIVESGGWLIALEHDGTTVEGFPFALRDHAGWSLTAGDLDGDGTLELVTGKWYNFLFEPLPFIWALEYGTSDPGELAWGSYRANPRNTGEAPRQPSILVSALAPRGLRLQWQLSDRTSAAALRIGRRHEYTREFAVIAELDPSEASFEDTGLEECLGYEYLLETLDAAGQVIARRQGTGTTGGCAGPPCTSDAGALCLLEGRFRLRAFWRDQRNDREGRGNAVSGAPRSGYFWFFDESNLELVVKTLDGTAANGHFWAFYGALSDVEYWIQVVDRQTGTVKVYHNPPGENCGAGDVQAFPAADSGAAGAEGERLAASHLPGTTGGTCGDDQALCLLDRFRVTVEWRNQRSGATGVGTAVPATDRTGLFWFFRPDNIELVLKMLDGRANNGRFWFFFGALSDIEYHITVSDTVTGTSRVYSNPPGEICGQADIQAF